jgi:membrane-associated phospholipid phosphatase
VILGIGGAAAALAHPADKYVNEHLVPSEAAGKFFAAGKYLGATYTQIGVALGIYTIGRYVIPPAKGADNTNKWSHLGFDLLRVQFITQAYVQGVKFAVRRDRPTGECCGFPSGHAATAFAVASVLERHLGYRFAWPTVIGAMYVATSRLHDNKHYLSDVLFGAAIGTAAGWTVVGRHGRDSYALVPQPVHGGIALMAIRTTR